MFDFEFYNVFIFYLVRKEDYDTFKNSVEEIRANKCKILATCISSVETKMLLD